MRFHLDEHMPNALAFELRRRGIEVTTTHEASLLGAPDVDHVEFGQREHRVIVTDDTDFLALARAGIEHRGIVYCRKSTHTLGQIIEHVMLISGCFSEDEMLNHVEYF